MNVEPATTPAPLTRGEARAVQTVAALVAVLGLVGFANSFVAVQTAVAPSFGWWAWSAPLGVDVAIAAFSGMDIALARLDMRLRWLRLVPWALTGATVYLNVALETDPIGRVAHAALPLLWVMAVEVGAHATRVRAKLVSPTRMERVRRSRWLLAPASTAVLWRRMVLWEVREYADALTRERSRLLAQADMRDAHGRWWRWRAPLRARVLYRLGEMPTAPAPALLAVPAPVHPDVAPQVHPSAPVPVQVRPTPRPGTGTGRSTLAEMVARVPADDPRSNSQLAREFATSCGLTPRTARRYVGEMRSAQ